MLILKDFVNYLNELLQIDGFKDYCTNGIQVEGSPKISKIATAVSASLKTLEMAVQQDVQVLIVHHGLFWNGDNYVIEGTKKDKLKLLLDNNISLLAYHLPLDAHQKFGNNWKAAHDLGWRELQPFGLYQGNFIGVQGKFKPTSREKFQQQLEKYYQHSAHCALGGKEKISSAALISGGAYKNLGSAVQANVDCYVTGNFDEPAWHQAFEEKINFFALGHSATERIGPKALAEHIQKHFRLPTLFIDIENPF